VTTDHRPPAGFILAAGQSSRIIPGLQGTVMPVGRHGTVRRRGGRAPSRGSSGRSPSVSPRNTRSMKETSSSPS